ncbi:hypothetical protein VOLCADRAFT_100183 [Volvox carteri f. nagariensis]|uniref:Expansin-like EG45 domain-containing protein n=1 Tax=Volvox carteri f. nagariensis TaxID=3068 RepID=D8UJM0_VOLCA|nr:uncharacterized protein VOLCADRAFT_100183 [Volvox carteri f. nagariensis]EFJ40108.1 hypothetical protein VOLCADRAFT_100183 [Volvox carteri f. nagariensis]|eukprot:XP_002958857.1 hypothetical protein VOLCADRAFT_100183 [Volvox carteri f. nagariensis]
MARFSTPAMPRDSSAAEAPIVSCRQQGIRDPVSSRRRPTPITPFLAAFLGLITCSSLPYRCLADWDGTWHKARATRYGGTDDGWNINEGSCGYGYLDHDRATGWDIAAMSDANWDFAGSCGRCFEVRCDPTWLSDNYGQSFDRTGVCRDPEASVVVQITDSCPCNYPNNAWSNRRWCCGDMYHFDMSTWAFEKLAENRWGVIGIIVRPVSCDYQPERRAPVPPEGESPPNTRISRPWGWFDRRPWP